MHRKCCALTGVLLFMLCHTVTPTCIDVSTDGSGVPSCTPAEEQLLQDCAMQYMGDGGMYYTSEQACTDFTALVQNCLRPGDCVCAGSGIELLNCQFKELYPDIDCPLQCGGDGDPPDGDGDPSSSDEPAPSTNAGSASVSHAGMLALLAAILVMKIL